MKPAANQRDAFTKIVEMRRQLSVTRTTDEIAIYDDTDKLIFTIDVGLCEF